MGISKPFYRIARPKAYIPDYAVDPRYAKDRLQLSRAYVNIEKELRNIFNYIEPDEDNRNAFSFELYSLLLRACTEVELNCKQIMEANDARSHGNLIYPSVRFQIGMMHIIELSIIGRKIWKIDINPPQESDWLESELYEFEWSNIAGEEEPFGKFLFNNI